MSALLLKQGFLNEKAVIGGSAAFYADALWNTTPLHGPASLTFLEHYHVGLALLTLNNKYADGAGAYLVASEFFQSNPYGLKQSEPNKTKNLSLGMVLSGLMLLRFSGDFK